MQLRLVITVVNVAIAMLLPSLSSFVTVVFTNQSENATQEQKIAGFTSELPGSLSVIPVPY